MAYTKKVWKDAPDTSTPINAANLNHMEDGIATADANATTALDGLDDKQDATDNTLATVAKTIVGAIDEVNGKAEANADAISQINSDLSDISDDLTIKVGTIYSWNEWLTNPYGSVKQYGKLKVLDLTFMATNPSQTMWHKICVTSIKPSQEVKISATGLNGSLDARWLPNGEVQFFTFIDQLEHHLHIYGIVIE